jgi:hypothetical protein
VGGAGCAGVDMDDEMMDAGEQGEGMVASDLLERGHISK